MSYPSQERHRLAWEQLARDIIETGSEPSSETRDTNTPGRLTVIGSGIETLGFTLGDRELIEAADRVFYCVADPATVVWLRRLRPDAFDLYVLYDDRKTRFVTYMQMSEAMLHPVRRGENVVVIYYGHPGVFVLSTHRAVKIARREGHAATMRSAVSALDCLCSDLGIDPAHPGLQTHEATDLMVRRRVPDRSLHVVLWQVGLIGEMGFRRQGYLNRNFSVFVAYLQEHYGETHPVTHYIASRYPTIPPQIERYALDQLYDPSIQFRFTGISTFYLPPAEAMPADPEMVRRLDLLGPGQKVKAPEGPLREIGAYGKREIAALQAFRGFQVPDGYHWQPETVASDFLIRLRTDQDLQRAYETDPARALADPRFARMPEEERNLLMTRDAGAVQIAAKGTYRRRSSNEPRLLALLRNRKLASRLLAAYRSGGASAARTAFEAEAGGSGPVDWPTLGRDIALLNRRALPPWAGVYTDPGRGLTLTLITHSTDNRRSLLYLNGQRVRFFRFARGILEWRASRGNAQNGFLRLELCPQGRRRLFGNVWRDDEIAADHGIQAQAVDPDRATLAPLGAIPAPGDLPAVAGRYALRWSGRRRIPGLEMEVTGSTLAFDGHRAEVCQTGPGRFTWTSGPSGAESGTLSFLREPLTGLEEVFGHAGRNGTRRGCHGARIDGVPEVPEVTSIDPGILTHLSHISDTARPRGGLMLWHRWEKASFCSQVMNRILPELATE